MDRATSWCPFPAPVGGLDYAIGGDRAMTVALQHDDGRAIDPDEVAVGPVPAARTTLRAAPNRSGQTWTPVIAIVPQAENRYPVYRDSGAFLQPMED
jgi:hypothetical protein